MSFIKNTFKQHPKKNILFCLFIMMSFLIGIVFISLADSILNFDKLIFEKIQVLFSHIFLFIIPSFAFIYIYDFDVKIDKLPNRQSLLISLCLIICIIPLIAFLSQINQFIFSPNLELIDFQNRILHSETFLDTALNLIIIAFIPAIGEELIFRGIIQSRLLKWLSKASISIVLSSLIFSLVHFDLSGILPRFALGLLLGYLFYWSKNLFIPIFIHFINNAIVVLLFYSNKEKFLEQNGLLNWKEAIISLFAVFLLIFLFKKSMNKKVN